MLPIKNAKDCIVQPIFTFRGKVKLSDFFKPSKNGRLRSYRLDLGLSKRQTQKNRKAISRFVQENRFKLI